MQKPSDPRKHGLKEPTKTIRSNHRFNFEFDDNGEISLSQVVDAWAKYKTEINDGFTIVKELYFNDLFDHVTSEYDLESENEKYEEQLADYNKQVSDYESAKAAYDAWEIAINERRHLQDIDAKIERAEHRVANLKAIKAGEKPPFDD